MMVVAAQEQERKGNARFGLSDLEFYPAELNRPECVLATASGHIFLSDGRGGVATMNPDGSLHLTLAKNPPPEFIPNGIAVLPDRTFLIANLGPEGGVWHLAADGTLTPRLREIDGRKLPATNFVGIDPAGRTWVTVSTWQVPRQKAFVKGGIEDGLVIVVQDGTPCIAAEGLHYTNEAKVDPTGRWLYVNETIGRRLNRYPIRSDGALGAREIVAEFGMGTFPDGLEFDARGGVWITSVVSNRLIRVDPLTGRQELMFQDADMDHVRRLEAKFQTGAFAGSNPGPGTLGSIASLAFGGSDLCTVLIGTVFDDRLPHFKSPIPGAEPAHWRF